MKPNNNPKNRRTLLDHQKRQIELFEMTEKESRQRRINSNLDAWINKRVPEDMKSAVPSKLHEKTVSKIKNAPIRAPFNKHIIISGEDVTNARFTSYALLYALVRGGIVTPSQIKITDVLEAYNNINGMFGARGWKEDFFEDGAKVLVVEGVSKHLTRLGSKDEVRFWRELTEFTKNNDRLVIVTYAKDSEEAEKNVFIPLLVGEPELNTRLIRKSMFIPLDKDEEETIENEKRKFYK